MFTVKATYRAETRKFTFPDDSFPSFAQLSSQLRRHGSPAARSTQIYKVFPLAHAYFISRLIFSPNPNAPGQSILVGLEAHSAEEYDKHVEQYKARFWPGALLRFSVLDETPHKAPGSLSGPQTAGESPQLSRPASVVHSDVSQTPDSAVDAEVPRMRLEDEESASGRGFMHMLDPIRERLRSQAAYASNRTSFASTATVHVTDDEYDDSVSETPTEMPEAASQAAGRLQSMSRLIDIVNNLQNPRTDVGEASSSTVPSERMVRLQETIGRMRDQSIRLKEASEALKERSSALRQQSMDNRPISPVSDDNSAASTESTVNFNSLANVATPRMSQEVLNEDGEDSLSDIGLRGQYWQNRFTSSSPAVEIIDALTAANDTETPAVPATSSASEHAFDEASQRTVNLGLELLRRTSSFSAARTEEDDDSEGYQDDSSVGEDAGTPWPPRRIPTRRAPAVADAADDRERSRLNMLSRLIARRPLPPCPVPVSQAPPTRGRSRSRSLSPNRPPSPTCGFVYRGSPSRPWRHTMPASVVHIASPRPISPSTMSYRSYSPGSPLPVPPRRCVYSPIPSMRCSSPWAPPTVIVPTTRSFDRSRSCSRSRSRSPAIICRHRRSPAREVQHNCGWSAECDKLKRQIDDVQSALADLRIDFECAVSDRQLKTEAGEAPAAAQTAAATGAQSMGRASQPFVPPSFPPGFVPSLPEIPPSLFYPNYPTCTPSLMAASQSQSRPMSADAFCQRRESDINAELSRLESKLLPELKQDIGLAHKNLPELTVEEKTRIVDLAKARNYLPLRQPLVNIRVHQSPSPIAFCGGSPASSAPTTIHAGVVCDGCDKAIVGARHKCLDCSNFDLCSECLSNSQVRRGHNAKHAFFPIEVPGEHTLFEGARSDRQGVEHYGITCDGCHTRLHGVRHKCIECADFDLCEMCISSVATRAEHPYGHHFFPIPFPWDSEAFRVASSAKCLNCPDFDTCQACFAITPEHHPGHGFVRVGNTDALMLRDILRSHVVHSARCNECNQPIRGTRYKCLHEDCPDYDLCQGCEAIPIAVHPLTHPMVKLKVPETHIPVIEASQKRNTQPTVIPVPRMPGSYTAGSWAPWCPPAVYSPCSTPSPVASPAAVINELPSAPTIPPLIPAAWTPPESWRWNNITPMTPPCPMVVPRMVPEETSPLFQSGNSVRTASPSVFENQLVRFVTPPPPSPPVPRAPLPCVMPRVVEIIVPPTLSASTTPERVASPAPLPRSPPPVLIDFDEHSTTSHSAIATPGAPSSLQGLTTPSEGNGSSMALVQPVPRLEPVGDQEWRHLWPELTSMLQHLLQPPASPAVEVASPPSEPMPVPGTMTAEETRETPTTAQEYHTAVEESPLAGEALLSRPTPAEMTERSRDFGHNLRELLNRVSPVVPTLPALPVPVVRCQAAFVSDGNIPDGQIFPPGAEFVKSWKMRNDGDAEWPGKTTLRYVAGSRLSPEVSAALQIPVGSVDPGTVIEVIGGEMKAPDVPGKYVSYWRLHDGNEYFGNSVWVDIEVAEPSADKESSDESLAASSVIMPPAPSAGAKTPASAHTGGSALPSPTILTGPPSDDGSYASSMSLIDAPSSPSIEDIDELEEEDEDIFQDSREVVVSPTDAPRDIEYVVLYDTSSSEDEL
ncbi:hypothetical protein PHLGIDRAFT_10460 [Phlebiopsis gigantea 11061_1 CR5-6]|uniref:ZZ-type domain-containing protein n=1 Tax=Phlebiopsis gigantea (strain 11061_1 CR5-6) TaxID=745531 RepID=A0A0C3S670_PHLG1|nr:hypothetical protein PHLGIDRAFT_10460 [Phlebiopsis gigantea 11061_1 CR5-6]